MTASQISFPKTYDVFQQGVERQLHTAVQIHIVHDGQEHEIAWGENHAGVAITKDSVFPWLSAGKPLTAIAIGILVDRGLIDLEATVAQYLPDFAANNKSGITLTHLLTHTAGLEDFVTGWPKVNWNDIVDRVCASSPKPNWIPGQRAAYDSAKSWFLLGEIIQRLTQQSFEDFLQTEICKPLNLKSTTFVYRDEQHRPEQHRPEQHRPEQRDQLVAMYERDKGVLKESAWNDRFESPIPSPGASLRATASEVCRFYQMLLEQGAVEQEQENRLQILKPETIKKFTARVRENLLDETLRHKVDYGLGLSVNSNRYGKKSVPYGFGMHCGESTFGHGGSQCSIAFADPENRLAVAAIANARPGEGQHQRRFRALLTALYEDLSLVDSEANSEG